MELRAGDPAGDCPPGHCHFMRLGCDVPLPAEAALVPAGDPETEWLCVLTDPRATRKHPNVCASQDKIGSEFERNHEMKCNTAPFVTCSSFQYARCLLDTFPSIPRAFCTAAGHCVLWVI